MMECHKCHKGVHEVPGWLERVNEKGVPGVFECRPACDAPPMDRDAAVVAAIEGTDDGR